jgi:ATP-dependent metalloprotease
VLWSNTYETLSPETRTRIEDEVRSLIDEGYTRAMSILKTKREELERLAAALLEYETLSKEEIDIVIKGGKLKRKPVDDRT